MTKFSGLAQVLTVRRLDLGLALGRGANDIRRSAALRACHPINVRRGSVTLFKSAVAHRDAGVRRR